MCLSTVYIEAEGQRTKLLEDIARMEANDDGYVFTTLFGDDTFIRGQLIGIDFVEDNAIVLKAP